MKNYQHLNLEQKIARIRMRIPVILKKFHSDEVDYNFTKLDDIYNLMTPALNKYGVNFDPIAERPTQLDETGRPAYLTKDEDGYWRYEADLDLCWTNAERPEEQRIVTIHAIGTHDIPDKAKGAAWTYALKTYLRNKFNIRQESDEDPDMISHDVPEDEKNNDDEKGMKGNRSGKKNAEGKTAPKDSDQKSTTTVKSGLEKQVSKDTAGKKALSDEKVENKSGTSTKQDGTLKENKVAVGDASDVTEFQAVSTEEEIPFDELDDDGGLMDALSEELEADEKEDDSALASARNIICTFGIFNGKTLGDMLESGQKGKEALRWLAYSYKGSDTKMTKAAKMLLESNDIGEKAA